MIWVKTLSYNFWMRIFDFGDGLEKNNLILAEMALTGKAYFSVPGIKYESTNVDYPLDKWVHVAVTSDKKTKFFINGVLIHETDSTVTVKDTANNYIGRSQVPTDGKLHAVVDDFKIFNKALSVEEILKEKGDFKEKEKTVANSLVNHWPMDNSEKDIVGGKDMVIKENGNYTTDRFGNNNSGYLKFFLS